MQPSSPCLTLVAFFLFSSAWCSKGSCILVLSEANEALDAPCAAVSFGSVTLSIKNLNFSMLHEAYHDYLCAARLASMIGHM